MQYFPYAKCEIDSWAESVPGCCLKVGGTRQICGAAGDRCLAVCGGAVSADWGRGLAPAGRGTLSFVASPSRCWSWGATILHTHRTVIYLFFKKSIQSELLWNVEICPIFLFFKYIQFSNSEFILQEKLTVFYPGALFQHFFFSRTPHQRNTPSLGAIRV